MPPKRKRPVEAPAPAKPDPPPAATRRATRQTPVLPPLPLTSAAARAVAAAAAATAAPAAAPVGAPSATARPATTQTPVPIPTPLVSPKRSRGRPQLVNTRPPPAFQVPIAASAAAALAPTSSKTRVVLPQESWRLAPAASTQDPATRNMASAAIRSNARPSDLVAPEITYHVPQPPQPGRLQSSLVRPHGPTGHPPRLDRPPPPVVTPVPPPKPPTLPVSDRVPPRPDRNIDKVVLGNLCFRTWYPSYYGKEVLGDTSGNAKGGSKEGAKESGGKASSKKDRDQQPMLERLYVCPSCFKYAKELVAWRGHVRFCERQGHVPGRKIYTHPKGRRKILVAHDGKGPGIKRRRGDGGMRYMEEIVQDEGEWSIWEVDGEKEGLFCQNLSLFAKLFLDNKSVFFDVTGFNYFLLVYTPPPKPTLPGAEPVPQPPPQVTGFFSKEKMSWDNNNLACILVFPPWQRKGLGALLMGASYEISRREGVLGGPEKPISDLGKKGYKRFWSGEIARWLLRLDVSQQGAGLETIVDVNDVSQGTWISTEDCLAVLREMGVVVDAGIGPGKPEPTDEDDEDDDDAAAADGEARAEGQGGSADGSQEPGQAREPPAKAKDKTPAAVHRVRVDKEAVRRFVATHRISLERTCDANGFVEGYAVPATLGAAEDGEGKGVEA